MSSPRVRVTGDAARFLQLLEEFGHLSSEGPTRIVLGAAEMGFAENDVVGLADVRRASAIWLFGSTSERLGADLLGQDWPLLFS